MKTLAGLEIILQKKNSKNWKE